METGALLFFQTALWISSINRLKSHLPKLPTQVLSCSGVKGISQPLGLKAAPLFLY